MLFLFLSAFMKSMKVESLSVAFSEMQYVKPWNLFHYLLKTKALERGRLLGVDVGNKYVGILPQKKTNMDLMAADFQSLISELSLVGFIIGHPFDRQRKAPDAIQVRIFIDKLSKMGKLDGEKCNFWNECFTSKNVELLAEPLNLHPFQLKTISDKFAAVQILQAYMDYVKKKVKLDNTE